MILILAAGKGTRMRSELPKVMHRLAGWPLLRHVLKTAAALEPARIGVVVGPDMPSVEVESAPHRIIRQVERLGTGHAVAVAREALVGIEDGTVLVVYGDTPLIRPETLTRMVAEREESRAAVVVLGMRPDEPGAYGRLIAAPDGELTAIVEAAEATPEQLAIPLCNSGVMAIDAGHIWSLLDRLGNANAKGEYYLTDIVAIARQGRVAGPRRRGRCRGTGGRQFAGRSGRCRGGAATPAARAGHGRGCDLDRPGHGLSGRRHGAGP